MKNIITKLTQAGGVLVLALVLGIGASVFAVNYAGPTSTPPGNNAPVPLNVEGTLNQTKGTTGDYNTVSDMLHIAGTFKANILSSFQGAILNGKTHFPGTTSQVQVGGATLAASRRAAFDIDLTGRGTGPAGTDGLYIKTANPSATDNHAGIITNSNRFHFWSDASGQGNADIWAGLPRFNRGSPSSGKVLAAYNTDGDANWGTISGGGLDLATSRSTCHQGGSNSANCGYEWGGTAAGYIGVAATAWCPSGFYAISGGGDCQNSRTQLRGHISQPIKGDGGANSDGTFYYNTSSWSNGDQPAGWRVSCGPGDAHAQVICAKTSSVTVTVSAPPTPTPPPAPVKSWKSLGSSIGVAGQTCLNLSGVSSTSDIRLKKNDNGVTSYVTNGTCYYESVSSTQSNPIINSFSATYSNTGWYPVGAVQNLAPDGYDYTLEAFKY